MRRSDAEAVVPEGPKTENTELAVGRSRVFWSLVIEALNLFTSAFVFLVLSQFFTIEEYGRLGALIAMATIAGPIATFGANYLLIKQVVISDSPERDLGRGLCVAATGTAVASTAVAAIGPALLPSISRSTIFVFLLGQLVCFWLIELSIAYSVALGRLRMGAALRVASTISKLGGLGLFALGSNHALSHWALLTALSGGLGVLSTQVILRRLTHVWPILQRPTVSVLREGLGFAFGSTTEGFLSASDKPLLLRFGFDAAAGFYAAGYRLISLTFVPLMALLRSQDRAFFSAGARGPAAAFAAGRQLSLWAAALMVPVSIGTFIAAPLVVRILPESYSDSADVLRFLALLPAVKGFQFAFGNVLSASGNQSKRVRATLTAAALNLIGNLVLIPTWSWEAAATTTIATEAILAFILFFQARRAARLQIGTR